LYPNIEYLKILIKSTNVSQRCQKSISNILIAFKNIEDWSYQMYNSWAKFAPSGILEGTVTDFGDYD
jgi:hypothetical protein